MKGILLLPSSAEDVGLDLASINCLLNSVLMSIGAIDANGIEIKIDIVAVTITPRFTILGNKVSSHSVS